MKFPKGAPCGALAGYRARAARHPCGQGTLEGRVQGQGGTAPLLAVQVARGWWRGVAVSRGAA